MSKLRRVVALLSVIMIIGLVIAAVIFGITGSKYFLGTLFLALAVPIVLWVFMWFTHLVNGDSEVIPKEDLEKLDEYKKSSKGNGAGKPTPK